MQSKPEKIMILNIPTNEEKEIADQNLALLSGAEY
jgi:acetate kinase